MRMKDEQQDEKYMVDKIQFMSIAHIEWATSFSGAELKCYSVVVILSIPKDYRLQLSVWPHAYHGTVSEVRDKVDARDYNHSPEIRK